MRDPNPMPSQSPSDAGLPIERAVHALAAHHDSRRVLPWLILAAWTLVVTLTQARELLNDQPLDLPFTIASEAVFVGLGCVACTLIYFMLEKMFRLRIHYLVIAVPLMGMIAAALQMLAYDRLLGLFFEMPSMQPYQQYTSLVFWSHFYLGWGAVCLALLFSSLSKAERVMRAEAEAVTHRARMLALRYQLNPHFLFNALNSVTALVIDGEDAPARRMLKGLSSFLQRGLTENPFDMVPLTKEVEHQIEYLSIEMERFADRLKLDVSVAPEVENAQVPGFILQPLIENAVKHGVSNSSEPVTLSIHAQRDGDDLVIAVAEDSLTRANGRCVGMGIGLDNVRARLFEHYRDRASFKSGPSEARGFASEIRLPLDDIRHFPAETAAA